MERWDNILGIYSFRGWVYISKFSFCQNTNQSSLASGVPPRCIGVDATAYSWRSVFHFHKIAFLYEYPKAEVSQIPAQLRKNLGYCLRLQDRNRRVGSPALETSLTRSYYCKNFSDLCFHKAMSGSSLEGIPAGKGWICFLQTARHGAGPISHTRALPKSFASNILDLAGQPQPALLFLGNESRSQELRSYFMQVFAGQSSRGSDWECSGAVCSQPSPGEELAFPSPLSSAGVCLISGPLGSVQKTSVLYE